MILAFCKFGFENWRREPFKFQNPKPLRRFPYSLIGLDSVSSTFSTRKVLKNDDGYEVV